MTISFEVRGTSFMTVFLFTLGQLLLGGAFIVHAVRNQLANVPRLSGLLSERNIRNGAMLVRLGIGLQGLGGALTVVGVLVPALSVLGGLALIVFLVVATLLFHPIWAFPKAERSPHIYANVMNAGLCGAFLMVIAHAL
jgi:putative oxidoreductase